MQRSSPLLIYSVGIKSMNLYDGVFMGLLATSKEPKLVTVQQSVTQLSGCITHNNGQAV
jgi:hypothetical protein